MTKNIWWGTMERPSVRMVSEIQYMKNLFNLKRPVLFRQPVSWDNDFYIRTLKLEISVKGSDIYWEATFQMEETKKTNKVSNSDQFVIQIAYPSNYPSAEPQVNVVSHDTSGSPHLFKGGKLCLHSHSNARSGWDPSKSTAATFGVWSIQWIRAWLYWKKTKTWPNAY